MSPQNPQPKLNTKLNIPRLISFLIILILLIAVGAVVGLVAGSIATLPDYDLNNITGALSSTVFDMNGESVASLRTSKDRIALDPEEIPKVMKDAIVAVEDQRFYRHHGIDFIRLGGAVIANITRGYGAEGGSTITQQLVKQAILENPEKTMKRKIQEAIIAIQVEFKYDKEEILALYLNNIYYGHSAWSLQTASQIYFGKDAQDITLAEAALLAGVVNLPGKYSPYLNMDNAKHRQALVLDRMVEMGYITENQAAEAKKEAINLVGLESRSYKYQSFLDYVVDEALAALDLDESEVSQVYTAGYQIYTTMDSKTQEFAEKIYADEKNFPAGKEGKIIQSALVILDPHNGEIRTLIGGRNVQGERLFNRAVNAYRQPGSAFKPIAVFAPALEKGYSPATVLDDYPEEYSTPFGPKTFVNYDGKYRGLVSMRTSLQYSINTTAVKMLQKIGVSEGINFSKNLGITSLVESGSSNDLGLSLALGGLTTGVSPLELTAAYGVFANQGVYVKPHAIKKIEDKDGNILFEHQPEERTVMSAQSAYLMNDMLQTVVQSGTGTRARLDRPVAGKTGTTSFDVEAWFVGYTTDLVGTIWLGYDQKETMRNVYGGSSGAPIWSKVMKVAHEGIPVTSFPMPSGIVSVEVDYKSGLLPSELTPPEYLVTEKFNSNAVPQEISNVWTEHFVCAETGELLTNSCPSSISKVFLTRPVPWTGNIAPEDAALELPTIYCTIHGGSDSFPYSGLRLQGSTITDTNDKLTGFKLSWYNPDPDTTTAYKIYRATQSNIPLTEETKVVELSAVITSWEDTQIEANQTYYYRIVAVTAEEPLISNEIVVNKPVPGGETLKQPILQGQVLTDNETPSVELKWSPASENQPVAYYIFRSENADFEPSSDNQIAVEQVITGTSWIDRTVEKHKTYYYKIIGFDMRTNQQSPLSNQLKIQVR